MKTQISTSEFSLVYERRRDLNVQLEVSAPLPIKDVDQFFDALRIVHSVHSRLQERRKEAKMRDSIM